MNQARERVIAFIRRNFLFGAEFNLQEDASFLEEGIIDSTGILELVDFLEAEFSLQIRDEELIPENLDSLGSIVRFLETRLVPFRASGFEPVLQFHTGK